MYGVAGQWFKPFALTIACSVLVSLFVSFSLDPMLSAYWPDPQTEAHERRNPIARTLDRFNRWFDRLADRYKDVIAWALDHRLAMVGLALASFLGALTIPAKGILAALAVLAGLCGDLLDPPEAVARPARRGARRRGQAGRRCWRVVARDGTAAAAGAGDRPGRRGLRAGERPQRVQHDRRDAAGLEPGVHPAQGGGSGAACARRTRRCAYTYTTVGTPVPLKRPSVDQALVYVRLVPKAERDAQPGGAGPDRCGTR